MNPAADKITETLRAHKYLTGKELLSIFALRDIGFCDQDVCCRIRFPKRVKLDTIYYLKTNEKQVLERYIHDKWKIIKGKVLGGEFSGDDFPSGFRTLLQDHLESDITFLEADIGSMQDDIADAEAKCEDYEAVLGSL
ncbi:MAG: hypothetical protein BA864_06940 [Desulfuromonadales bacterium C00003093]|nr:MAG: hypothetical protein BA864_06940 [Desulfuromonadales bacterium C00003093]